MFKFVESIGKNTINKKEVGIFQIWLICLFIKKIEPLIFQLVVIVGGNS